MSPEAQHIVYDNQRGAETYAVAASPIAKGTIMVHDDEAGQSQARLAGQESPMDLSSAGIKAYPVPLVKEGLWVELPAREQAGAWKLSIFDVQGRKVAETSIECNHGTKKHWPLVHHIWKEGVYLLEIKHGDEEYQLRILK